MIDIHTHLLPQVDDGPDDWQDAIALLRQGIKDGIQGAVCTSHVLDVLDSSLEGRLQLRFDQLKEQVKKYQLKIKLWLGSELHAHASFKVQSPVATMNGNGKYLMIEFPMGNIPADAGEQFFNFSIDGVTPILVHPERNAVLINNPEKIFEFVQRSTMVQVNAGSITGVFGKEVQKVALNLVDNQLAHFVASDCHSVSGRPMILSHAYKVVQNKWGEDVAQTLFHVNPLYAIQGKKIDIPEPQMYQKKKKFFRFGK